MTKDKRGRDARSGKFIPIATATRRKATSVVETIKKKSSPKRKKNS